MPGDLSRIPLRKEDCKYFRFPCQTNRVVSSSPLVKQGYFIRPLAKVKFSPPNPPTLGGIRFKVPQNWGIYGAIKDLCKSRTYALTPHIVGAYSYTSLQMPLKGAICVSPKEVYCRQRKLEEMEEMREMGEMGKKIPQILTLFYTPIPLK